MSETFDRWSAILEKLEAITRRDDSKTNAVNIEWFMTQIKQKKERLVEHKLKLTKQLNENNNEIEGVMDKLRPVVKSILLKEPQNEELQQAWMMIDRSPSLPKQLVDCTPEMPRNKIMFFENPNIGEIHRRYVAIQSRDSAEETMLHSRKNIKQLIECSPSFQEEVEAGNPELDSKTEDPLVKTCKNISTKPTGDPQEHVETKQSIADLDKTPSPPPKLVRRLKTTSAQPMVDARAEPALEEKTKLPQETTHKPHLSTSESSTVNLNKDALSANKFVGRPSKTHRLTMTLDKLSINPDPVRETAEAETENQQPLESPPSTKTINVLLDKTPEPPKIISRTKPNRPTTTMPLTTQLHNLVESSTHKVPKADENSNGSKSGHPPSKPIRPSKMKQ